MKTYLPMTKPGAFCYSLTLLLAAAQAGYAGGVVTNNTDAALRAAVAGGGLVTFATSGTIVLTNTLSISNSTIMDATGHDVTISGANLTRLFNVQPGVTLSLNNLTLAHGLAQGTNGAANMVGGPGQGGAVYNNNGLFSASNCVLVHNIAAGGIGGAGSDPFFPRPGKGGTGSGGAIYNQNGRVSLTNCTLNDNRAIGGTGGGFSQLEVSEGGDSAGGAIYSTGGTVLIMDCLVSSNRSISGRGVRRGALGVSGQASAGGIELGGGQMTLLASVLVGNLSQTEYSAGAPSARGGATTQNGGSFAARDCVFSENSVLGGFGLGIATPAGQPGGLALGGAFCLALGVANVTNSTFVANLAEGGGQPFGNSPGAGAGGGVYNLGNLQLVNCTFSGNAAKAGSNGTTGRQGGAYGGGLYNYGGTVGLMNTTIANNAVVPSATNASISPIAQGGGIYSVTGDATLLNTIVANSLSGSNAYGTLVDGGYNLSSDSSCNFTNTGSLNNADPVLGPLDDYGGPTPTLPLLSGSPAINGGDPLSAPPTDQRGRARPYGPASDIGAYESSPSYVIRGRVSGFTLADEVAVSAGATITTTTNRGVYSLEPMAAGSHAVTTTSADYLFVPDTRLVTVGPDQLGANFTAYHWNALSLDGVSSNVMQLRYAGTNGHTVRLLASSNLFDWSAVSTNTVGSSNLVEFRVPVSTETPRQFYRAVQD